MAGIPPIGALAKGKAQVTAASTGSASTSCASTSCAWADVLFLAETSVSPGNTLHVDNDWGWNPALRYLALKLPESSQLDASTLWSALPSARVIDAEASENRRGGFSLHAVSIRSLEDATRDLPMGLSVPHETATRLARALSANAILPFSQASMDTRCFRFDAHHIASIEASQSCITAHASWSGKHDALFVWRKHARKTWLELAVVTDLDEGVHHAIFRPLALEHSAELSAARPQRVASSHLKLVRST